MALHKVMPEDLDAMVRPAIARNLPSRDRPVYQVALDEAIRLCYDGGELELAALLLLCSAARVQGRQHAALELLMQDMVDHRHVPPFGAAPNG